MAGGPIGIIVNPASGKDIRRLVANASVFDNREKRSIVRRAILGAVAAGASDFLYMPDSHGIVRSALEDLDADATFREVETPGTASALDTTRAAAKMREAGCEVVITLGGDGTNRAVAMGWQDAPLVAVSTGTNNVFPRMVEGTLAGAAAGCVASGLVALGEVSRQVKCIHASIEGERDDLALIDAVLLDEPWVGARAIWDARRLRTIVLARAEPASVGMSAVGGLLRPMPDTFDGGFVVEVGPGGSLLCAPIAPGLYASIPIRGSRDLALGQIVEIAGPGVLAFDGERERRLKPGQRTLLTVRRDGPHVIDVALAMRHAACAGIFQTRGDEGTHGD
jgi:predicted polyphosphate/ATP-dependent NAD kinase